jgi:hypothetical protein
MGTSAVMRGGSEGYTGGLDGGERIDEVRVTLGCWIDPISIS